VNCAPGMVGTVHDAPAAHNCGPVMTASSSELRLAEDRVWLKPVIALRLWFAQPLAFAPNRPNARLCHSNGLYVGAAGLGPATFAL
jgi:hypothetical protein